MPAAEDAEWLEADGLGGFASGTVNGIRTRRYHALLLAAARPPVERAVLVNGVEAWIETPGGRFALSSNRYAPDVVHPDGARRLVDFTVEPWPRWTFRLDDGTDVEHEVVVVPGAPRTLVSWRVRGAKPGTVIEARLFLSGRDYHSLHLENPAFRFDAEREGGRLVWRPYAGVPAIAAAANGEYVHEPHWFRNFLYTEERARGLDAIEDLASPGLFRWDLARVGEALLVLEAEIGPAPPGRVEPTSASFAAVRDAERARRARFPSRLHRAADAYLVRRGEGVTVIAGYPWFSDWGRDTFVALRGLCLATGRLDQAAQILREWSGAVSEGMMPNRFPDRGETPEFNAVDASLWYVVAVDAFFRAMEAAGRSVSPDDAAALDGAVQAILEGYARGTRYGIRLDRDGLIAAGTAGVQLTWMDAKVGDRVITPRIGKPVEIQALWLNAVWFGARYSDRWRDVFLLGRDSFRQRFWNEATGHLHDVVDADHQPGATDPTLRPNQIIAVGGLPVALLAGERARRVVETVETKLWTPLGLRSLSPDDPAYVGRYLGGPAERDAAYHQGSAWPWLAGPFVEAWVRAHGGSVEARREARQRFLDPLLGHLDAAGLGHLPEIADGDPPHTPRGCPFQAWSVGEALWLDRVVLAEP